VPLANNVRIVFPHIAKTGGTTLQHHFRANLSDDEFLGYGNAGRCRRFFEDRYQVEELAPSDKSRIAVVQGHRVEESVLAMLGDPNAKLMIVLRHPVAWMRSRFNHRYNALARYNKVLTTRRFLRRTGENSLSKSLLMKFPSFIDDHQADDLTQSRSVLSKFDYVLTTERLSEQAAAIFPGLGLPAAMERKRTAEKKQSLDISDDDLLARNSIDYALFAEANGNAPTASDVHNGLGFDKEGKARAMERLLARPQPAEADRYRPLANALNRSLLGEAAMAKIQEEPDKVAVRDLAQFRQVLTLALEMKKAKMNSRQSALSARKSENWRKLYASGDLDVQEPELDDDDE